MHRHTTYLYSLLIFTLFLSLNMLSSTQREQTYIYSTVKSNSEGNISLSRFFFSAFCQGSYLFPHTNKKRWQTARTNNVVAVCICLLFYLLIYNTHGINQKTKKTYCISSFSFLDISI
jgi:hypothetical protein